jgi:hypothetical protein
MISAREFGTDKTWNIRDLEDMENKAPGSWDRLKADTRWVCIECGEPAHPRRRSKDGRAATWVARHREEPECGLKSRTITSEPGNIDRYLDPVENTGTILRLLFEYGSTSNQKQEVHAEDTGSGSGNRTGTGHGNGDAQSSHEKTQRLGAMLRHLMSDSDYVQGMKDDRIHVPDRGEVRPEDLIWKFDELDPDKPALVGNHVVVWGVVRTANDRFDRKEGTGSGYLNQGLQGESTGVVEVTWQQSVELLERYKNKGINNFWSFEGWYVIAYGIARTTIDRRVRISPQGGSAIALLQAPSG